MIRCFFLNCEIEILLNWKNAKFEKKIEKKVKTVYQNMLF